MGVESEEGKGEFRIQLHFQPQRNMEKRCIFYYTLLWSSLLIYGRILQYTMMAEK